MTSITGVSQQEVISALTEILPVDTAERLADHLTPADVATLRNLVRASVPANTLRAVALLQTPRNGA